MHLESRTSSQVPPFFVICLSYACHTNSFFISLVDLSYPCHILVITKLEKDIPGVYQSVPNLQKICQTSKRDTGYMPYTDCIFSGSELHVPVICLAYPCHNFFQFRRMQRHCSQQMKFSRELNCFDFCIPRHDVHQAQQELFAAGMPAGSLARGLRRVRQRSGPAALASSGAGAAGAGTAGAGAAGAESADVGLLRSASKCQGSWCLHFARSRPPAMPSNSGSS